MAFGGVDAVVVIGVPVVVDLLAVLDGKKIWNLNLLRTTGFTVAAGGTRDEVFPSEDSLYFCNGFPLCLIERLEVLHKAEIVFHLLKGAHAGKNHGYTFKACSKADGIAG